MLGLGPAKSKSLTSTPTTKGLTNEPLDVIDLTDKTTQVLVLCTALIAYLSSSYESTRRSWLCKMTKFIEIVLARLAPKVSVKSIFMLKTVLTLTGKVYPAVLCRFAQLLS